MCFLHDIDEVIILSFRYCAGIIFSRSLIYVQYLTNFIFLQGPYTRKKMDVFKLAGIMIFA